LTVEVRADVEVVASAQPLVQRHVLGQVADAVGGRRLVRAGRMSTTMNNEA